ncbi:MAG: hypothetical protein AAGJ83_14445, partial [Planctomycetota bacterium]
VRATLLDCLPEQLAVEVMVDLANLRGGPDNTTVLVITVDEGPLIQANQSTPPSRPAAEDDIAYWGAIGAIIATLACLLGAVAFWLLELRGSMVITLLGALVAGVIAATSFSNLRQQSKRRRSARASALPRLPKAAGGNGPYRRYASSPDQPLFDRLGKTVAELKEAAKQKNWLMDWGQIDSLQRQGVSAMDQGDGKAAIEFQARAIVETMQQLREQHDRSAGETAIDS